MTVRHWFLVDGEWVERREALLVAWEDRVLREARERATAGERSFIDSVIATRERNASELRRRARG